MKKIIIIANLIFFISVSKNSNSQRSSSLPVPIPTIDSRQVVENMNGDNKNYLRNENFLESILNINGERVFGTPFLYDEWFDGVITTKDGRVYNYKLRYNVYDQVVSYILGKDTMDVNEEIKNFILMIPAKDSIVQEQFINANQFRREKNTFYYEVIIDKAAGQLLKANKKVIRNFSDVLLSSKGKTRLVPESIFFYYNNSAKKIFKIRADESNLGELLNVDNNTLLRLHSENYDFTKEADIISFFTNYFQRL